MGGWGGGGGVGGGGGGGSSNDYTLRGQSVDIFWSNRCKFTFHSYHQYISVKRNFTFEQYLTGALSSQ